MGGRAHGGLAAERRQRRRTGLHLIQAKEELGHGRFGELFQEKPFGLVPFGQRTANKLMRIARNGVLADFDSRSRICPRGWRRSTSSPASPRTAWTG